MIQPVWWTPLVLVMAMLVGTSTHARPPKSSIYLSFTADQAEYQQGESALLSWATANVKFCQASGDWSGKLPAQGTYRTGPLEASKRFILKCLPDSKSERSQEEALNVFVAEPDSTSNSTATATATPPALSFSANETSINSGDSTTLHWTVIDADSCVASGGWSGDKAMSGSENVAPTSDTTFILSCSGAGGSNTGSVRIAVNPAEPTLSFSVSETSVSSGGSTTLSWRASDAENCTASGGWSGARSASGSEAIGPISAGTTYSLSCSGPGGSVVDMLSIAVISPISVAWRAPTENVDGTPLSDLMGYRIYYGDASRAYTDMIEVIDPLVTSHTLDLTSGDHHIAMTALDQDGNESAYSNEVLKTAP